MPIVTRILRCLVVCVGLLGLGLCIWSIIQGSSAITVMVLMSAASVVAQWVGFAGQTAHVFYAVAAVGCVLLFEVIFRFIR